MQAGYRHIDGAWAYNVRSLHPISPENGTDKRSQNEEEVGKAIKESGIAREDLWITSKVNLG